MNEGKNSTTNTEQLSMSKEDLAFCTAKARVDKLLREHVPPLQLNSLEIEVTNPNGNSFFNVTFKQNGYSANSRYTKLVEWYTGMLKTEYQNELRNQNI